MAECAGLPGSNGIRRVGDGEMQLIVQRKFGECSLRMR